jgi:hypothetical protein
LRNRGGELRGLAQTRVRYVGLAFLLREQAAEKGMMRLRKANHITFDVSEHDCLAVVLILGLHLEVGLDEFMSGDRDRYFCSQGLETFAFKLMPHSTLMEH